MRAATIVLAGLLLRAHAAHAEESLRNLLTAAAGVVIPGPGKEKHPVLNGVSGLDRLLLRLASRKAEREKVCLILVSAELPAETVTYGLYALLQVGCHPTSAELNRIVATHGGTVASDLANLLWLRARREETRVEVSWQEFEGRSQAARTRSGEELERLTRSKYFVPPAGFVDELLRTVQRKKHDTDTLHRLSALLHNLPFDRVAELTRAFSGAHGQEREVLLDGLGNIFLRSAYLEGYDLGNGPPLEPLRQALAFLERQLHAGLLNDDEKHALMQMLGAYGDGRQRGIADEYRRKLGVKPPHRFRRDPYSDNGIPLKPGEQPGSPDRAGREKSNGRPASSGITKPLRARVAPEVGGAKSAARRPPPVSEQPERAFPAFWLFAAGGLLLAGAAYRAAGARRR